MSNIVRPRKTISKIKLTRWILQIGLILVIFLAFYKVAGKLEAKLFPATNVSDNDPNDTCRICVAGKWYEEKPEIDTTLVIGVDKFGELADSSSYNNDGQSDFLMLLYEDGETGNCAAIHLNRDTMTNIPVLAINGRQARTFYGQLALAFNYGNGREESCRNVSNAVSNLLYGLEIDHYVAFTMDAVPILNDMVGGVPVKIEDNFTGVDDTLIYGTTVTLEGEHALNFVRSRNNMADDKTNVNRMKRQKAYVESWANQAKLTFESDYDITDSAVKLENYLVSDYSASEMQALAMRIDEFIASGNIYSPEGETVLGDQYMEFYVDESELRDFVLDTFYSEVEDENA